MESLPIAFVEVTRRTLEFDEEELRMDENGRFPHETDEGLKANVIRTAQHHRKTCPGESCNVSLFQLVMLLDRAGIRLNNQELREFL